MSRRSHTPPFMRRFQRTFPPKPEESQAEPTLQDMMDAWEGDTPAEPAPEPTPTVTPKEAPKPSEPEAKSPKKVSKESADKLMSFSRKQLVKMATEAGAEIPTRATKREIAELLAGTGEVS